MPEQFLRHRTVAGIGEPAPLLTGARASPKPSSMKTAIIVTLAALFACAGSALSDIPDQMEHMAKEYDRSMKTYDANYAALVKAATDQYLAALNASRKWATSGKREHQVAAVDAELEAMKAGKLPAEAPKDLPADLGRYRERYLGAPERAKKMVDPARENTRQRYLHWLDRMERSANLGKSAELEAAVVAERKRVLAVVKDGPKPDEKAKPAQAEDGSTGGGDEASKEEG